jgi:hypothetical protein
MRGGALSKREARIFNLLYRRSANKKAALAGGL